MRAGLLWGVAEMCVEGKLSGVSWTRLVQSGAIERSSIPCGGCSTARRM
jgi:hypothetical protein